MERNPELFHSTRDEALFILAATQKESQECLRNESDLGEKKEGRKERERKRERKERERKREKEKERERRSDFPRKHEQVPRSLNSEEA